MEIWQHSPELVRFSKVLDHARHGQSIVPDEVLIEQLRSTYWGTNCWSWVEMSLALISATCALRPHLGHMLIQDPIEAMIAGGLEDENDIIAQGVALARKDDPYVPLTEEGRAWLEQGWPLLEDTAKAIFRRRFKELQD